MEERLDRKQSVGEWKGHKAICFLSGNKKEMICYADDLSLKMGVTADISGMRDYMHTILLEQKEKEGFYGLYLLDSDYHPVELVWKFYFRF